MIWQMREPFLLAVPEEDELKALNILREFYPNAEDIGSCYYGV